MAVERRIMKHPTRGALLGFGVALAAFAAVSILATLSLRGERERNRLLAQYEAERIASGLFLIVAQSAAGVDVDPSLTDPIIRAATYDAAGRVEPIRIGAVPNSIDPQLLQPGQDRFEYNPAQRTLTLYRRRWLPDNMRARATGRRGGRRPVGHEYILLEVDAADYFRADRRLLAAQFGSPFLIAAVVGGGAMLMRNNARFRRRLDAQRQLVELGEAARTLTHEIKNPLSAIRLKTAILRRTTGGNATADLQVIDDEVSRLALLADRVSEFIRDPAGNREAIDIGPLLDSLTERHHALEVQRPTSPLMVRFDRERLRSVLDNLVTNAIESTVDSSPVTVTAEADARSVTVRILDRGTGIPAGQRERMFDPFYTTKPKGSGIGLAICRRFVLAAGGTIELRARAGGGTEAVVTLPQDGTTA
jgi:two-component system sensor histidine kinase HydH